MSLLTMCYISYEERDRQKRAKRCRPMSIRKSTFSKNPIFHRDLATKPAGLPYTHDIEAVVKHLHLTNIRKANWHTGLHAAYSSQHDVFVSPPVQGWTFVVGCAFPDIGRGKSPHEFTRYLQNIGAHFEDVQYFGTHRVVEYQAWARVKNGQLIRGYAYLGEQGETLWNEGENTPEKDEICCEFFDERSPEATTEAYWEREDLTYPDGCIPFFTTSHVASCEVSNRQNFGREFCSAFHIVSSDKIANTHQNLRLCESPVI